MLRPRKSIGDIGASSPNQVIGLLRPRPPSGFEEAGLSHLRHLERPQHLYWNLFSTRIFLAVPRAGKALRAQSTTTPGLRS
jgi:hypothetical protein